VTWCCQGKIYTWNSQFGLDMGHDVDVHRNHGIDKWEDKGLQTTRECPLAHMGTRWHSH
jgi:hypothetical protein